MSLVVAFIISVGAPVSMILVMRSRSGKRLHYLHLTVGGEPFRGQLAGKSLNKYYQRTAPQTRGYLSSQFIRTCSSFLFIQVVRLEVSNLSFVAQHSMRFS